MRGKFKAHLHDQHSVFEIDCDNTHKDEREVEFALWTTAIRISEEMGGAQIHVNIEPDHVNSKIRARIWHARPLVHQDNRLLPHQFDRFRDALKLTGLQEPDPPAVKNRPRFTKQELIDMSNRKG